MNELRRPLPLALLIAGIALIGFGLTALGVISLIGWISALAVGSLRKTAEMRAEEVGEDLDTESRTLFAPIKRLVAEIEETVSRHGESAVVKTVGGEAAAEAKRIRDQMVHALTLRGELKRVLRDRGSAELETRQMEERLPTAGAEERASLQSALTARRTELEHFVTVEAAIHEIDGGVQQAKAALSEMKSRLAISASEERAATDTTGENLRESLSNLRALALSFDEAEEVLGQPTE